jgi:hypothetical protein
VRVLEREANLHKPIKHLLLGEAAAAYERAY